MLAAPDAREVQRPLRRLVEARHRALEHGDQILLGARRIAAHEHDAIPRRDVVADRHPALFGIDGDQVAHGVIAGIAAGIRQTDMDVSTKPIEIAGQQLANVTFEDVQRRLIVEANQDILRALGHEVCRPQRCAAL